MNTAIKNVLRQVLSVAPAPVRRWADRVQERRLRRAIARKNIAFIQRGRRLVPEDALETKYREAIRLLRERGSTLGDYLEFGVFNGSSLACMHRALVAEGAGEVRLFGFDSFEGLPAEAVHDDGGAWKVGQFSMDIEFTKQFLTEQGVDWQRVHLVKGWFSETLTPELVRRHQLRKASVIMVDCDMYTSAKSALAFCAPLIEDVAVILFDDWYSLGLHEKNLGEKRAFDEFMAEHATFEVEDFGRYHENSQIMVVTRQPAAIRV